MVRRVVKVAVFDAALLAFGFFVLQDVQWRSAYAASRGLTPSYSYSLLTQVFTMAGQGSVLRSPPTLDWVELIVGLLLVVNVWYLYRSFLRRGRGSAAMPVPEAQG